MVTAAPPSWVGHGNVVATRTSVELRKLEPKMETRVPGATGVFRAKLAAFSTPPAATLGGSGARSAQSGLGPGDLAPQHRHLMPEHHDLGVLWTPVCGPAIA